MPTQTILIIGAGYAGDVIAASLMTGNFHVLVCDKDHVKAACLVKKLKDRKKGCDIEAMQCSFESAWEADIIILTMNLQQQKELALTIKNVINQKILVSMVHPVEDTVAGVSGAESQCAELQELLPNSKVVCIFNYLPVVDLPVCNNINSGTIITGSDDKAVRTIFHILDPVNMLPINLY